MGLIKKTSRRLLIDCPNCSCSFPFLFKIDKHDQTQKNKVQIYSDEYYSETKMFPPINYFLNYFWILSSHLYLFFFSMQTFWPIQI